MARLSASPASIGWGTSAAVHAAGILVAWLTATGFSPQEDPKLPGHEAAVELRATWAVPEQAMEAEEPPPIDASVLILPERAQIATQRFRDVETTLVPEPAELAEAERLLRVARSSLAARARTETSDPPPEPQALPRPPLPRQSPTARLALPTAAVPPSQAEEESVGTGEETPPRLLDNRPPAYPPQAVLHRWEGTVLLRIQVTASGRVGSLEILTSSGYPVLDAAAVRAVRTWRFEPARRDGRAIAATIRLPVRFSLR